MLFSTPPVTPAVEAALAEVADLATQLHDSGPPTRWMAVLRRSARGAASASSVGIEGFMVDPALATALVAGDRAPTSVADDVVVAYGRAMDHVVAMADDPQFKWNARVIADLHFDLAWPHPETRPGRLRVSPMGITGADGRVQYTAPDAAALPTLLSELVSWLRKGDLAAPPLVRAAMAHLHLVSIHPFADGNGRASRVLQSLVLARSGHLAPELASIEEYLGQHTQAYYDVLHAVQGTTYDPSRSAAPWIEFCATAHVTTARRRADQIRAAAARWNVLEELANTRGWPDRLVIALERAVAGSLDRAGYATEAEVSPATASADLRRLLDAGWVHATGAGPSTIYRPTSALLALLPPTP